MSTSVNHTHQYPQPNAENPQSEGTPTHSNCMERAWQWLCKEENSRLRTIGAISSMIICATGTALLGISIGLTITNPLLACAVAIPTCLFVGYLTIGTVALNWYLLEQKLYFEKEYS